MSTDFKNRLAPAPVPPGEKLWFLLRDGAALMRGVNADYHFPRGAVNPVTEDLSLGAVFFGELDGTPCVAEEMGRQDEPPEGMQMVPLRSLLGMLDPGAQQAVSAASQFLEWRRTGAYCSACGTETENRPDDWGRRCRNCSNTRYPPVSPALLILVHDGADGILLGHKPTWGSRYSILAGFVEPGESLEGCARREAMEETGVEIENLVYAGSQSWPFPNQIMIGFEASAVHGEPRADGTELDDARWFRSDSLPDLPPPESLSRRMIEKWIRSVK